MLTVENRNAQSAQPEVITTTDVENMSDAELLRLLINLDGMPNKGTDNKSIIISAATKAAAEGK